MKKILLCLIMPLVIESYTYSQNVGIGTTTPGAKLEVKGSSTTSSTYALMIKNSSNDTLVRVRNTGYTTINYNGLSSGRPLSIGGIGMNFFRDDNTFSGSIFPTDSSIVLWSDSQDSLYVILQPSWGKVGIGTYSPDAKLEVKGDVILGNGGSIINKVLKATIIKNIGSIAAGSSSVQNFTIAGANVGSTVYVSPELALPDGFLIAYARVSAANSVEVKFINVTGAAINPATMDFYITVIE